ncbi:hypothetical protein IW148_001689 [Coemansia sp. RSA 1199]|nr:hypothetical protein IW148_001689 [Coemansia sp. RSA 1199]
MNDLELANLDTLLENARIASTEDLTRALRSASLPLQQRLALAWALFDGSGASDADKISMQRLSAILVRKEELLSEWLISTMLNELKTTKPEKYVLHRDPAAISLFVCVLESISKALSPGTKLDVYTVVQRPLMPLFLEAFAEKPTAKDARYVVEVTRLWRFVVESTTDGLEMVSAQPDQLVRLLTLLGSAYIEPSLETDSPLERAIGGMLSLAAYAMRRACEASLNPRKMFGLFDESLLLLFMQVASAAKHCAELCDSMYDMLHASLFHVECMGRFIAVLTDKPTKLAEGEQSYVVSFLDIITKAVAEKNDELRARYVAALPGLLDRYLQAAALVCSETRSMATTTLGLSAVAANPLSVTQAETNTSCLGMYAFMHKQLITLNTDERVLAAINQLARTYFGNSCFGTTSNSSIISTDIYQKQADALNSWLESIIRPILDDPQATSSALALALDGISLALDAGPDLVQAHSEHVLNVLSCVPTQVSETATATLGHLISTFKKARRLDLLVSSIAKVQADRNLEQGQHTNLLVAPAFLGELSQAVSQAMPHAQVAACITNLVDALVAEASKQTGSERSSKRRRLSHKATDAEDSAHENTVEMLTIVLANFVLASVATVSTEHQSIQFSKLLVGTYTRLMDTLAGKELAWERLLLHYVLMEAGSRLDGTERWLEACMYPERVRSHILTSSKDLAGDPRIAALGMLVAFQTAAHWTVLESSIAAGILPESVVAQIDTGAAAKATRKMISSVFPTTCLVTSVSSDSAGGWQAWDGQAHHITRDNCQTAQWALLVDWLELACEYADAKAVHNIAMRISAGLAGPSTQGRGDTHALLSSASFFEVPAIREAFAPALVNYALDLWRSQTGHADESSKSPKLARKVDSVLEHLAEHKNSSATKGALVQEIGSKLVNVLGVSQPKAKHCLSAEQTSAWIQLIQSLLQFPDAYWQPADAHVVFALALSVDIGVAAASLESDDADLLRTLACELLERMIRIVPSIALEMLEDVEDIVGHWAELARHKSGQLAAHAQSLLCHTIGSLAQASFGQSNKAADSACRKLCMTFYKSLDDLDIGASVLVLEVLHTFALLAQQYTTKLLAQECGKKWVALVTPWINNTAQSIAGSLAGNGSSTDDSRATCVVGVYAALQRLRAGFTGDGNHSDDIAASTVALFSGNSQTSRGPVLALAIYAAHASSATVCDAPKVLAFLVRRLAANPADDTAIQRILWPVIAAIAGVSSREHNASVSDAILSHVIEPLLKELDGAAFAATFMSFLKAMQLGERAPVVCGSVVQAFIQLAHKQDGSERGVQRQRMMQRRVGTVLTALNAFVGNICTASAATSALRIVNELVVVSGLRCTMNDVSELLAIVQAITAMPLRTACTDELADLYCLMCQCLGGTIRRHTGAILDSVSVVVAMLRSLQHAFITQAHTQALDVADAPWIAAYSPLPVRCAEAYSRVLNDLCQARRLDTKSSVTTSGEFVKLTRGTGAANTASVLTAYVPHILAEYCVIQAGGASVLRQAMGKPGQSVFRGLSWRPTAAVAARSDSGDTKSAIVASPAVREALLPGWYALLDIMTADDRQVLLALLAGQPTTDIQRTNAANWPSVFGPDRHDGAHEILKTMYQSYVDFYKYTGQF